MDHRNKTKVPDPAVKDLITAKNKEPNTIRKQCSFHGRETVYILNNNSKGTAFLLQGLTENDSEGL